MGMTLQEPGDPYSVRPPKPRFPHPVRITAAALSRDGSILVALDAEGAINGWDARSTRLLYRRPVLAKNEVPQRLTCSSDGRYLALSARYCPPSAIRVLHLATGEEVRRFPRGFSPEFSADGEILAATDGPTLRRWALKSGAELPTLHEEGPDLKWLAYSAQGDRIAVSAVNSGGVVVWNLPTRERMPVTASGLGPVTGLAFSPDGTTLAIGRPWAGVQFWNLAEDCARDWHSHEEYARGQLRFSGDGRRMIASVGQRRLLAWEVVSGRYLHTWGAFILPDGLIEVSAGGDVAIWIERGGIRLERLPKILGGEDRGHVIRKVAFTTDGRAVTADDQGTIRLWDPATQKEVRRIDVPKQSIHSLSEDGVWIVFGGRGQPVRVWDLAAGKEVFTADQKPFAQAVALSPDRKSMALGYSDGSIALWDIGANRERCLVRLEMAGISAIAWSPDGRKLALGDGLGAVLIADGTRVSEPLHFKARGDHSIQELEFTPDGKSVVACDQWGSRRLYRDEAGVEPQDVRGTSQIPRLDDRWNASGFDQKNAGCSDMAVSPDKSYVITAGEGIALIWQAPGAK